MWGPSALEMSNTSVLGDFVWLVCCLVWFLFVFFQMSLTNSSSLLTPLSKRPTVAYIKTAVATFVRLQHALWVLALVLPHTELTMGLSYFGRREFKSCFHAYFLSRHKK